MFKLVRIIDNACANIKQKVSCVQLALNCKEEFNGFNFIFWISFLLICLVVHISSQTHTLYNGQRIGLRSLPRVRRCCKIYLMLTAHTNGFLCINVTVLLYQFNTDNANNVFRCVYATCRVKTFKFGSFRHLTSYDTWQLPVYSAYDTNMASKFSKQDNVTTSTINNKYVYIFVSNHATHFEVLI